MLSATLVGKPVIAFVPQSLAPGTDIHELEAAEMEGFSNDLLSEILEKRTQDAGEQENHAANKTSMIP